MVMIAIRVFVTMFIGIVIITCRFFSVIRIVMVMSGFFGTSASSEAENGGGDERGVDDVFQFHVWLGLDCKRRPENATVVNQVPSGSACYN